MNTVTRARQDLLRRARENLAAGRLSAARADFEEALAMGPAEPVDYNDYGRVLNNLREFDQARQALASAVALDPGFAEAHNNLGHVLRSLNKAAEAADCFRQAVALRPEYGRAWQNLGTVLALTGNYDAAIDAHEKALALAPGDADAHLNLAGLYRVTDAQDKAIAHVREACRLAPTLIDAKIQLASLLEARGEIEESIAGYHAALELDKTNPEALAGLADVLDKSGAYQQGLAVLAPGRARHPHDPGLAIAQARLLRRSGHSSEALALLMATRSAAPEATTRLPRYFYTLGELYDEVGEFEAAFASFQRANELKSESFSPVEVVEAVDALIAVFNRDFIASAATSGNDSHRPVFIVGMPRSGTSLVEQMLASHPAVFGAGELRLLVDLVKAMGRDEALIGSYPECVPTLTRTQLEKFARSYLESLPAASRQALRVTDKMPHNFLHLGLISLLLPGAHIIHCRRNPLDTILSCYFQNFASSAMAFTNNLEHLAIYYQQYLRLMRHWRTVVPRGFYDVHYERLVENPESESAAMLEFLGLEWDDAVLEFHHSRRLVKTASHAQVRRPLYKTSVARHVHYKSHLTGVEQILGVKDDDSDH